MKKHNINIGDVFNKLTVIGTIQDKRNTRQLVCQCECSKEIKVFAYQLINGLTKSCGCWKIKKRWH